MRLCIKYLVENEEPFIKECKIYNQERIHFLDDIRQYAGIDTKMYIKAIGGKRLKMVFLFSLYEIDIMSLVSKMDSMYSQFSTVLILSTATWRC